MDDEHLSDGISGPPPQQPRVTFQPLAVLNPATLLPEELADHPHDRGEVLTHVTGITPDLRDIPLPDAEMTLFTEE